MYYYKHIFGAAYFFWRYFNPFRLPDVRQFQNYKMFIILEVKNGMQYFLCCKWWWVIESVP
jgi:hypothetical protein